MRQYDERAERNTGEDRDDEAPVELETGLALRSGRPDDLARTRVGRPGNDARHCEARRLPDAGQMTTVWRYRPVLGPSKKLVQPQRMQGVVEPMPVEEPLSNVRAGDDEGERPAIGIIGSNTPSPRMTYGRAWMASEHERHALGRYQLRRKITILVSRYQIDGGSDSKVQAPQSLIGARSDQSIVRDTRFEPV